MGISAVINNISFLIDPIRRDYVLAIVADIVLLLIIVNNRITTKRVKHMMMDDIHTNKNRDSSCSRKKQRLMTGQHSENMNLPQNSNSLDNTRIKNNINVNFDFDGSNCDDRSIVNDKNYSNNCQSDDEPSSLKQTEIQMKMLLLYQLHIQVLLLSLDVHKNAYGKNLNDPNDPNGGNNNNSGRTRNAALQLKFNVINAKLDTIKSGGLTVNSKDKQHDGKLLSRVDMYNIASKKWVSLPDLGRPCHQAQGCMLYDRIVITGGNAGSLLLDSENQRLKQDMRSMNVINEYYHLLLISQRQILSSVVNYKPCDKNLFSVKENENVSPLNPKTNEIICMCK